MRSNTVAKMGTSTRLIHGLVSLLLYLQPCVSTKDCPGEIILSELDPLDSLGSVLKPPFQTGFMSSIVHSFLNTVQPNPFPKDLFITRLKSNRFNDDTINEILHYEVGFLVCAAIGVLYITLMPLIGFCFACCRCCGKCGGYMYQEQTNNINCRRRSFYWTTFLITIFLLAGNICMFLSSSYTHKNVKSAPGEFNNALNNLQGYINTIPKQINQVLNKSNEVVDNVKSNINDIGPLLGREIKKEIESPINEFLDSATVMVKVVEDSGLLLSTADQTKRELDSLQSDLNKVINSIKVTLSKTKCQNCIKLQSEVDKMNSGASVNLPDLSDLQSAVGKTNTTDLNEQIQKGKDFLNNIPEKVDYATTSNVKKIQNTLQTIKKQLSQATKGIPLDTLKDISRTLSTVEHNSNTYKPTIDTAEELRWNFVQILCFGILLVVACNLLGLILGPVGLVPEDDPTDRSVTANCSGLFFMAGVGFSFIFSWIFMIVVLILFLVGGNTYTLICVPWKDQQLFQVLDTPGVIPGFDLSQSPGLKSLTISDVYNDCQMNKSLWNTLHLEDIINLTDYLNVSKYTGQVKQALESSQITLPNIVLLNSETIKHLRSFSASGSRVDLSSFVLGDTSFATSLSVTADKLDQLADFQTDTGIISELKSEATQLRRIKTRYESTTTPQLTALNSQINHFSGIMSNINRTVENVVSNVNTAQDILNNKITDIVQTELSEFVDCQVGHFEVLAKWAYKSITEQVGRCGPVADTVNTVENLFCSQLVDSLNAFWFSLGWCMVFLVPSIIFSVKLAKFYRQMKYLG